MQSFEKGRWVWYNCLKMVLFDYLICNEDRHGGNWGLQHGRVTPLFDHNIAFGGDTSPVDAEFFFANLTFPFYLISEHAQNADKLVAFVLSENPTYKVLLAEWVALLEQVSLPDIAEPSLQSDVQSINKLFQRRLAYVLRTQLS